MPRIWSPGFWWCHRCHQRIDEERVVEVSRQFDSATRHMHLQNSGTTCGSVVWRGVRYA